ncbi:hypothetical protein A6A04_12305 [Paramagnetospirillum marisnigri]|uniref:Phage portal protein n=1 Tax=Paramagnetospirillum marisnigri TaxID=1285242 RepID=A0A178MV46_9PROT|nr:phage portal protein [Paramagnetospirillum marisnigri]OAN54022.1 hypothetical protein A6A04_12305 [Paramagnetospirillum marisnigri]
MGIFNLFRKPTPPATNEKAVRIPWGSVSTEAGVWVDDAVVMQSVAGAAIGIIAEAIASCDIVVRRVAADGTKRTIYDHPLTKVLSRRPNGFQDPFAFRLHMMHRLLRAGDVFYVVVWDGIYNAKELIPIPTPTMLVTGDGDVVWSVASAMGDQVVGPRLRGAGYTDVISDHDVLRIGAVPSIALHGLRSSSPTDQARGAIGLATALERHCASLFSRGARPSGALSIPGKMSDSTLARIRAQAESFLSGVANHGRLAIFEEGMTFQPFALDSVSAQTMEQRRLAVEEVARFYRIPLSKLAANGAAPRANVEAEQQAFINDALLPWMERIESAMTASLLQADPSGAHIIEFDVANLLRGDVQSRAEAAATYRSSSIVTINEARRIFEGLPPLADSDADAVLAPLASNVSPAPPGAKELTDDLSEIKEHFELQKILNGKMIDAINAQGRWVQGEKDTRRQAEIRAFLASQDEEQGHAD